VHGAERAESADEAPHVAKVTAFAQFHVIWFSNFRRGAPMTTVMAMT
jgi:hypothetical protein